MIDDMPKVFGHYTQALVEHVFFQTMGINAASTPSWMQGPVWETQGKHFLFSPC